MNIIQKIFGGRKKAMSFQGYTVGAAPVYFTWNKQSKAYSENDSVYTVIKRIARKASSVPIYAYKPKSDIQKYKAASKGAQNQSSIRRLFIERVKALDEIDTNNPLAKLMQNPNPSQGSDAFFEGLFSFYALRGEAFIWLNRGGIENGEVLEMYIIPPDNMSLVPDPTDLYGVMGWLFDINGKQVPIPKEDIIHWKTFNPVFDAVHRTHLRGFDPLQPLGRRVQMDNDSMDAAVAMFQNGGAKGVLYNETLDQLTPDQATQLKSVVDSKINNTAMKAAVATLQGKWGYVDIGKDSTDMQLLQSQDMTLTRIANGLGADADLFVSGQTFSNKEWAQKNLVLQLVMPMCFSLRDELNRSLVPAFKGNAFVDFDFSMLPELQDDIAKLSTTYNGLFDRGIISGNEYRELAGFEKTDNPIHEMYLITGQYNMLEDVTMQPEEPQQDNLKYNDYGS
jgi:HK97 family phage portal protein